MATVNNMTFQIAGAAGQGVESSGAGFAQALARGGLHIFGLPDYMSRIRGGLNSSRSASMNSRSIATKTQYIYFSR